MAVTVEITCTVARQSAKVCEFPIIRQSVAVGISGFQAKDKNISTVVEVVVDENGKVVSARAISGAGVLRDVAVQAALRARFSPTKLSGQPIKIVGMINYNFTMPQ